PGAHAVVVLDGAGWHQTGGRLRVPDNITLRPLPAYCPELNPVENVWQYLRQNELSFTVWDSVDAIVDTCCAAWNKLVSAPDTITSIATKMGKRVSPLGDWYYTPANAERLKGVRLSTGGSSPI